MVLVKTLVVTSNDKSCGGQRERLKDILLGNENTNLVRAASQRLNESIVRVTKTMIGLEDDKKCPTKITTM